MESNRLGHRDPDGFKPGLEGFHPVHNGAVFDPAGLNGTASIPGEASPVKPLHGKGTDPALIQLQPQGLMYGDRDSTVSVHLIRLAYDGFLVRNKVKGWSWALYPLAGSPLVWFPP